MVHSGSRAVGQAIRDHYLERAERAAGSLRALDVDSRGGQAYPADVSWARRFTDSNHWAIPPAIVDVVKKVTGVSACRETAIAVDHNHVAREEHDGRLLWVHRKGV